MLIFLKITILMILAHGGWEAWHKPGNKFLAFAHGLFSGICVAFILWAVAIAIIITAKT